jgi:hypothetical protein
VPTLPPTFLKEQCGEKISLNNKNMDSSVSILLFPTSLLSLFPLGNFLIINQTEVEHRTPDAGIS